MAEVNAAKQAQSLAVKRAEVEFHAFASLGEPERAMQVYAVENRNRADFLRKYLDWTGPLSPFLEIGANAAHTSYLLANQFKADGFALDISADSLRHGIALMDAWEFSRAPVRVAGDALHLPFADESLGAVLAFQMLSQFMDIESVFLEVKRVLAPGGVFVFAEEPMKRLLTLRLFRAPYYQTMKPWERKLHDAGLLGFLVRDVIGAGQEESFGIRQNHTMNLADWRRLVARHFAEYRMEPYVPERGGLERWVKNTAIRLDPYRSVWRAARLLGGTLAVVCRKAGKRPAEWPTMDHFQDYLRCPDCRSRLQRDANDILRCVKCEYKAANEGGVYNLLRSADRNELYPGDRADILDFSLVGHERRLMGGFHEVEGVFGNRFRWMEGRAVVRLDRVNEGPQRLRVRGHAPDGHVPIRFRVMVNGTPVDTRVIDRPGLFIVEADVPDVPEYSVAFEAGPIWQAPGDPRDLTVNLSMIRLVPR
jgi:SAM-dependent methyltransferase